ncbi:HNH endonuclease [Streptomyces termitum]|uniref:HNH endonuclease n=1 Tax=Streptomyces termitum TaxID=67368 RepID=UPI0037BA1337
MAAHRTKVPRPLARQLFVEAGHRCAIPTCRATPLEIAHIAPWHRVRRHEFHNLIVLCPNCHTRFDRGEIDRQAMLRYKELLRLPDPNRVAPEDSAPKAGLIRAYRRFQREVDVWARATGHLDTAITLSSQGFPPGNVRECRRAASLARLAADKLGELGDEGTTGAVEAVFEWHRRWTGGVFDLDPAVLIRSREEHEEWQEERFLAFARLHEEICAALDLDPGELDFFEAEPAEEELPVVALGTRGFWGTGD